jgi:opacity protein-like surface antigen
MREPVIRAKLVPGLFNNEGIPIMKRIFAAAAFLALIGAGPASAADPFTRAADRAADAAPSRAWQGPYVGIGFGYRWQDWKDAGAPAIASSKAKCQDFKYDGITPDGAAMDWSGSGKTQENCLERHGHQTYTPGVAAVDAVDPIKEDSNGFLVTGRIGYDWQRGSIVGGVFGDINWLNATTKNFADAHFSYDVGGRIGFLVNSNLLAYVNGGIEMTNFNQGLDTDVAPFVGGGLELMVADGWTIAAEPRITFEDVNLPAGISNNNPVSIRLLAGKKF